MYDYDLLYGKIGLPDDAAAESDKLIKMFEAAPDFASAAKKFVGGEDVNEVLDTFAENSGAGRDITDLSFCIYCSQFTREIYAERNISDDIFFDSMKDITIWNRQCVKDYGHVGIHGQLGWLSCSIRARLFRLGRFQYEDSRFHCDSYTKDGVTLKKGDRVINMHIPEDGPLYDELRYDSYRRAAEFWGLNLITCDTWLFYPRHREFFPENSRVLRFMDDFDIIDWGESNKPGDMWRVFGVRGSYEPSSLPRNTGMQRAYADWLEKTGLTGWGYGIRVE